MSPPRQAARRTSGWNRRAEDSNRARAGAALGRRRSSCSRCSADRDHESTKFTKTHEDTLYRNDFVRLRAFVISWSRAAPLDARVGDAEAVALGVALRAADGERAHHRDVAAVFGGVPQAR